MNTPTPLSRLSAVWMLLAAMTLAPAQSAFAEASWAFAPGLYTHNPQTGERVTQYAQPEPVEGLPDPRATVSRYWRTRTNLRGADGSNDTVYEVHSFGNTAGGFDAQRERGFDASLETLRALRPFRNNPYLFFGGLQGFGYGFPGLPAAAPYGAAAPQQGAAPCEGEGCGGAVSIPAPPAGQPGTAYPYTPPNAFVAPIFPPYGAYPYPYAGWGPGYGAPGYGPGYGGPGYGGPGYGGPGWPAHGMRR